jgi:hypothetical protein
MELMVSRKSWHYQVFKWMYESTPGGGYLSKNEEPKTLCAYFWGFWIRLFVLLVSWSVTIFIGSMLTWCIPVLFWSGFHNHSGIAAVAGFSLSLVWVLIGLAWIHENFYRLKFFVRYIMRSKGLTPDQSKTMSFLQIAVESVKATKNRFCPMITYTTEGAK